MMKRLLATIRVMMVVSAFSPAVLGAQHGSLTYDYIQRTIIITGTAERPNEVIIPGEIEGRAVTHIAGSAFRNSDLERVTLPETLTEIGGSAFSGSKLQEIHIPAGIETIERSTFKDCNQLQRVTGALGVRQIGDWAFGNCISLMDFPLASPLESIGEYAFLHCETLGPEITLPETFVDFGYGAFAQCDGIIKVTILSKRLHIPQQQSFPVTVYRNAFVNSDRIEELFIHENFIRPDVAKHLGLEWMFPASFFPINTVDDKPKTKISIHLVPQINLQGSSGKTVVVEMAFTPDGPWSIWKSVVLNADGTSQIVGNESDQKRFYRVRD